MFPICAGLLSAILANPVKGPMLGTWMRYSGLWHKEHPTSATQTSRSLQNSNCHASGIPSSLKGKCFKSSTKKKYSPGASRQAGWMESEGVWGESRAPGGKRCHDKTQPCLSLLKRTEDPTQLRFLFLSVSTLSWPVSQAQTELSRPAVAVRNERVSGGPNTSTQKTCQEGIQLYQKYQPWGERNQNKGGGGQKNQELEFSL